MMWDRCASLFIWVLLPMLLFAALGLSLLPDYEFSYDEVYETRMAYDNVALLEDYSEQGEIENPGERIVSNLEYYGTFFNLLAYAVQVALAPDASPLSYERLEIKRYVIFVFSWLGYAALAYALRLATNMRASSWLAFGSLGLMPLYFFYGFNNQKDVPFAVMMTVTSVVSAVSVAKAMPGEKTSLSIKQEWWLFAAGLAIGLCASIRIGGIVTLGFWGVMWLAMAATQRKFLWRRLCLSACVVGGSAFLVIWLMHPVAYRHPLEWIITALRYHAQHPYPGLTLTDGEWIYAHDTPWYFLPKWIGVKVPILWQILGVAGLLYAACNFRISPPVSRALSVAFALQLIFLPLFAIADHSHLYGDGRHFLFIYPAIAYFSSLALWQIWRSRPVLRWAGSALAVLLGAKIVWDMALLHPYEANYFIEPQRAAVQLRWDYLSESKEITRWLSTHTQEVNVLANTPLARTNLLVNLYSTRRINVYNLRHQDHIRRPYYFLDFDYNPRRKKTVHPECNLVYKVTRPLGPETMLISAVRHCP